MMQLTGGTAQSYNLTLLRTDWTYNLESGVKVLNGKFGAYKSNAGSSLGALNESNRNLIENWYMASWYYNGYVGNFGSYANKIFSHIKNRPGKLVNFLPAGLAPTMPDVPFSHFFDNSKGEAYAAKGDGSWLCVHGNTATAPVTPTGNSGGAPPPPPAPPPAAGSTPVDDGDWHDGKCTSSAGGALDSIAWLCALMTLCASCSLRRRNTS
jgi:hypothetical protein